MARFKPSHVNKRTYPGNANVIGPTVQATLGITTTTCCSCFNTCGACQSYAMQLGCRYGGGCARPCCDIICGCPCTTYNRNVPSGMWKSQEQYEAKQRDAWGETTSSSGSESCLSCTNIGYTCYGPGFVDLKGYYFRNSGGCWIALPGVNYWYQGAWQGTNGTSWSVVSNANSNLGSCGWFVPNCSQGLSAWNCRTYWPMPYSYWWTTTERDSSSAWMIDNLTGMSWNNKSSIYTRATAFYVK